MWTRVWSTGLRLLCPCKSCGNYTRMEVLLQWWKTFVLYILRWHLNVYTERYEYLLGKVWSFFGGNDSIMCHICCVILNYAVGKGKYGTFAVNKYCKTSATTSGDLFANCYTGFESFYPLYKSCVFLKPLNWGFIYICSWLSVVWNERMCYWKSTIWRLLFLCC